LRGGVYIIKENPDALAFASKDIGLEINADKTKYMFKVRDQIAKRILNMKTDRRSFEMVKEFKYLGSNLTITFLFRKKLRAD
jgi:hypothetical protein